MILGTAELIDPRPEMLFGNLLFAIALTVVWPLGMLGLLAACDWLERRTLLPEEVVPQRIQRMEESTPEALEVMVLEETDDVVAAYWSSPDPPFGGAAPPNGQGLPAATPNRPTSEHPAVPPMPATSEPASTAPNQPVPATTDQPATPPEAEPVDQAETSRVVPSRAARLAGRWPARGRHERR